MQATPPALVRLPPPGWEKSRFTLSLPDVQFQVVNCRRILIQQCGVSVMDPTKSRPSDEVETDEFMKWEAASGWYNFASIRYAVLISNFVAFCLTFKTS